MEVDEKPAEAQPEAAPEDPDVIGKLHKVFIQSTLLKRFMMNHLNLLIL